MADKDKKPASKPIVLLNAVCPWCNGEVQWLNESRSMRCVNATCGGPEAVRVVIEQARTAIN
jgi:predicted DCC family thiol-disulfide oxidoreductase YuxK